MIILLALGSLIGASALNSFSTLPQPMHVVAFCGSLLATLLVCWFVNKQKFRNVSILIISGVAGFSWSYFHAVQKLSWQMPAEDIQRNIFVCGKVDGISQWHDKALRFDLELNRYQGKPLAAKGIKVRLFWPQGSIGFTDGDTLCCYAKLKPRWHLSNPGTLDQEKQFFLEGIYATGKLVSLAEYKINDHFSITRWRQNLNERLRTLIGDKPFLGVIQATTLGLYQNITPQQWFVFQATGTIHAIAISGLHISIVALLCGGWVTFLVAHFPRLTNLYPAKCYGAVCALMGALIYSAMAGFSIPTQRALVMILVSIIALLKRQPILSWHCFALALIGILIVSPLAPLQIGFWLSFGCVAALIYGSSHINSTSRWRKWVVPQLVVFIGLLPLCSFFFEQIPLISPIANIIVLPIMDLVVVPASLIGLLLTGLSTSLASLCFYIAQLALEVSWWLLEKLAHVSFNVWQQGHLPFIYLLIALFCAILLLAPKGFPAKRLGFIGFLPMVFYQGPHPASGECHFTLLDVGQGLAAVIQTQHHSMLYDAGPVYGADNAGRRIIKPFLGSQHIKALDKVIISHSDLDHRGGLDGLADFPIGEILSSEPTRLSVNARQCIAGETWEWDGVRFAILNPPLVDKHKATQKRNNLSCVLKVTVGNKSILLTGDIEQGAEQTLLEQGHNVLRSALLVVPHHGSLTSSSQAFVQAVSPKYALFPVGLANQYGFPKQAVLKRYEEVGAINLLVSQTGALMFRLNQTDELTPPIHWRDTSRHYWHRQLAFGEKR